jgi:hypothetical protein
LWIVCLMFELVLADYRDVDSFPTFLIFILISARLSR